jgi:hypothetical protein
VEGVRGAFIAIRCKGITDTTPTGRKGQPVRRYVPAHVSSVIASNAWDDVALPPGSAY